MIYTKNVLSLLFTIQISKIHCWKSKPINPFNLLFIIYKRKLNLMKLAKVFLKGVRDDN